ncbi:MAG: hypothetical protein NT037_00980 [Hyphomicrobiales bacterium]|jgi:hypothetical protein|nr:hypothetical protein [Hyphomicrobiales bacterium]
MSRHFVLRVAVAVALGSAVLGATMGAATSQAAAQGWPSVSPASGHGSYLRHGHAFGNWRGGGFGHPRQAWSQGGWGQGGWGHGGWGHGRPGYGGRWRDRPAYGYGPPRCVVRHVRYWDGWDWVSERRRVCY